MVDVIERGRGTPGGDSSSPPSEPQMRVRDRVHGVVVARAPKGRQATKQQGLRDFELGWDSSITPSFGREARALDAMRLIADMDPQASQAIWNFLRLTNTGHQLHAKTFLADGSEEETGGEAQLYLDVLARRVGAEYGPLGLDGWHVVQCLSLLQTGAVAAEVELVGALNETVDWHPVDPTIIRFRRNSAGVQEIGILDDKGKFKALNPEQVFYAPLDPAVGDPYGRPMLLSAIAAALAKAQMLSDLRAAAHNAGYPRIDVSVLHEVLRRNAPPQLLADNKQADYEEWAERQLKAMAEVFQTLQTDDTSVHWDWVTVQVLAAEGVTFDFDKLEKILVRQLTSALKMLPVLLGINDTTTETHGSVQWQIQVESIKALQRLLKRVIERCATVSLQVAGFQAHASMMYDEIRQVDRKFEAEAALNEIKFWEAAMRLGLAEADEAANDLFGHGAIEGVEPQFTGLGATTGETGDDQSQNPTPTEKSAPGIRRRMKRATSFDAARQEPMLAAFEGAALGIFEDAIIVLERLLRDEGLVAEAPLTPERRDQVKDIADSVFGLGYRRQMKGLLRDAVIAGMTAGGTSDPIAPERLVDRIWSQNTKYVDRIRNDLKAAIRAGAFESVGDVHGWFAANQYREQQMGRFLAKQGLNAGYAQAQVGANADTTFVWRLGVSQEHCASCQDRADRVYTLDELHAVGWPGGDTLDCKSGCHCYIDPVVPEESAA